MAKKAILDGVFESIDLTYSQQKLTLSNYQKYRDMGLNVYTIFNFNDDVVFYGLRFIHIIGLVMANKSPPIKIKK